MGRFGFGVGLGKRERKEEGGLHAFFVDHTLCWARQVNLHEHKYRVRGCGSTTTPLLLPLFHLRQELQTNPDMICLPTCMGACGLFKAPFLCLDIRLTSGTYGMVEYTDISDIRLLLVWSKRGILADYVNIKHCSRLDKKIFWSWSYGHIQRGTKRNVNLAKQDPGKARQSSKARART